MTKRTAKKQIRDTKQRQKKAAKPTAWFAARQQEVKRICAAAKELAFGHPDHRESVGNLAAMADQIEGRIEWMRNCNRRWFAQNGVQG